MADPIVFIPGLNTTGELFAPQMSALAAEHTLIIANHRRHDQFAAMVETLLEETPPRFILCGLSMGGYAAFELLRQAPERVSALILMDTTARPDTEDARERRLRLIGLAENGRFAEIPFLQIPALLAPARVHDPALVALITRMAEETGADAFVRQQRAILGRPDSRPFLPAITCPTLVVVGDEDAITPPEHAREMTAGIRGATLAVMPACGHLSTLERPAAVLHAITSFLQQGANHGERANI